VQRARSHERHERARAEHARPPRPRPRLAPQALIRSVDRAALGVDASGAGGREGALAGGLLAVFVGRGRVATLGRAVGLAIELLFGGDAIVFVAECEHALVLFIREAVRAAGHVDVEAVLASDDVLAREREAIAVADPALAHRRRVQLLRALVDPAVGHERLRAALQHRDVRDLHVADRQRAAPAAVAADEGLAVGARAAARREIDAAPARLVVEHVDVVLQTRLGREPLHHPAARARREQRGTGGEGENRGDRDRGEAHGADPRPRAIRSPKKPTTGWIPS
jgi:hypothetical protein